MTVAVTIDRKKLIEIAQRRNIAYLALFGSVARGEATEQSDVDLAIRFTRPVSLFDYVDVQLEFEELLGKSVDLIPIDNAYSFVRDSMNAGLTILYEAPQNMPSMSNKHVEQ